MYPVQLCTIIVLPQCKSKYIYNHVVLSTADDGSDRSSWNARVTHRPARSARTLSFTHTHTSDPSEARQVGNTTERRSICDKRACGQHQGASIQQCRGTTACAVQISTDLVEGEYRSGCCTRYTYIPVTHSRGELNSIESYQS